MTHSTHRRSHLDKMNIGLSAGSLDIPAVTEVGPLCFPNIDERIPDLFLQEDLHDFHLKSFGMPFTNVLSLFRREQMLSPAGSGFVDRDHEDGLGYYPNGVKRTLTDDQIAMFRHSELYALSRQHSVANEGAAGVEGRDNILSHPRLRASSDERLLPMPIVVGNLHARSDGEDDEEEYQEFLAAERAQLVPQADSTTLNCSRNNSQYPQNRTISTRRFVRELDGVDDTTQTLDYGDEDVTSKPPMNGNAGRGKKIWWPRLGA